MPHAAANGVSERRDYVATDAERLGIDVPAALAAGGATELRRRVAAALAAELREDMRFIRASYDERGPSLPLRDWSD